MNVRELLEAKHIRYEVKGRDYVVLCTNPEHDDTNPSMHIDQILGIYKCFSCGHKGNIFYDYNETPNKLQMKREQLKRKIEKTRAESIGLELPEGYMPFVGSWRGIRPETYAKFGAFRTALMPELAGRLVFPITDVTGRIVVFHGRDETGTLKTKYTNWPRGIALPVFPNVVPIRGSVVITEGIFDMLNLHDKGLTNAVCIFGVNNITEDDLFNLKLQGVTEVVVALDPDEAGNKGADAIKEMCTKIDLFSRRLTLPAGKDPGDLSKLQVEALREKLYG